MAARMTTCWRPLLACSACCPSCSPGATGGVPNSPAGSASACGPCGAISTGCVTWVIRWTRHRAQRAVTGSAPAPPCRRCCWTMRKRSRWRSACTPRFRRKRRPALLSHGRAAGSHRPGHLHPPHRIPLSRRTRPLRGSQGLRFRSSRPTRAHPRPAHPGRTPRQSRRRLLIGRVTGPGGGRRESSKLSAHAGVADRSPHALARIAGNVRGGSQRSPDR